MRCGRKVAVNSRPWRLELVLESAMVSSGWGMGKAVEQIDEGRSTYQRARVVGACYKATAIVSGITNGRSYEISRA